MQHEPLDLTPQPAKETAWNWLLIRLGLARRNKTDERQQAAAVANKPWRDAEADRKSRQPGAREG